MLEKIYNELGETLATGVNEGNLDAEMAEEVGEGDFLANESGDAGLGDESDVEFSMDRNGSDMDED